MLTPYLPFPPASGGQIRTFNLLKYLSKNNEITLIALYKREAEKKYASFLKSYCKKIILCKRAEKPWQPKNILKSLFSKSPFLIVRNFSEEAHHVIGHLLQVEHYDVIHAETFYIMPHIPKTTIPILLVEQTIEYKVYQHFVNNLPFFIRPFFSIDIVKLKYSEKRYWKKATLVATVSQLDQSIVKREEPTIRTAVVPNGAGDEMFISPLRPKTFERPTALFVGNFYWLQNVEAAQYIIRKILPLLTVAIPNIKIIIAGQGAKHKLHISENKYVEYKEIAQDDVDTVKAVYRNATVFIAPIFGPGGTRLKILAAMASGLPIISSQTGIEGLGVIHNTHVMVARSPQSFVQFTKKILKDRQLYERLRTRAYRLAKETYSWKAISKKLEVVYGQITKNV